MAIEAVNAGEWKVRIEQPVFRLGLEFYIFRHTNIGVELVQPDGLLVRVTEGTRMDAIKPSLILSQMDGRAMMYALAEALAEEGIKTPNDHLLQGKLDAQGAHLQDLRTLLKLNKTTSGESK